MKHLIAFVDDEPNILRGLRRLLRSKRDVWDMVFLEGGEAAIEWLDENEPDAIITDMRMPNVDGAKVLEFAASHKKGRIRIVLSGEADRELTRRTVGRSHLFFSKPCDEVKLIRAIESAFSMSESVLPRSMQQFVSNLTTLPGATATHDALDEAFAAGGGDISRVVAHDPALALRVLQLANSSYFGRPADTLSIAAAVNNIGMEVLANLWETGALLAAPDTKEDDEKLGAISQKAISTAQSLYLLSEAEGASETDCEDSYALGLLSWAGDAVACMAPDVSKGLVSSKESVAIAAYLTRICGMPPRISQVMEHLVRVGGAGASAKERAEEIGAVKYNCERAF